MSILMIRCPQTGQHIPTGIETDDQSFQNMPDVIVYTSCPHCWVDHAWWPDEAWLAESLPRIAMTERRIAPRHPLDTGQGEYTERGSLAPGRLGFR